MERTLRQAGAPDGVLVCVNGKDGKRIRGEFYPGYEAEGVPFVNTDQMVFRLEQYYDRTGSPQRGTLERRFAERAEEPGPAAERKRRMTDRELLARHGDLGTFVLRVQHRQNSSWQGRLTWMEQNRTLSFRSIWEMIRMIESALDTVDSREEEKVPSWFEE